MAQWFRLGDLELLVVSDGVLRQDAGAVFGLTPRIMWEPYVPDLDDKHRLPMGLNSLMVRSGGKTVLVETGVGSKHTRAPAAAGTETAGTLLDNLAREGVAEVELAGDVGRRHDDAEGLLAGVDLGPEVAAVQPELVQRSFHPGRIVRFRDVACWTRRHRRTFLHVAGRLRRR